MNNSKTKTDIFLDKMAWIAVGGSPFSEETQRILLTKVFGPVTMLDLIMAWVTLFVWVFSKGI